MQDNPLIASNFALEVQGVVSGFFREVSGFDNQSEIIIHKMVNETGQVLQQKVPGELTWGDITLRRGITDDMELWNWRQLIIDGKVEEARKDGSIVMYHQDGTEKSRYNFVKGWPCAWKGPDVSADTNDIAIEEITITHEGLMRAS